MPKILVVDDETNNLEIISEYLEDTPCSLTTWSNSGSAWQHLEKNPTDFAVILLDWMMPEPDGMELLQRIKAQPELQHIPVIMQTARNNKEDLVKGIAAGAFYYLTKPYDQQTLTAIVNAALDDYQNYRNLKQQLHIKGKMPRLMQSADFQFRNLEEINQLSTLLANACPEPEKVISGISELLINAVEHGNLGIGYKEKAELKRQNNWEEEIERRLKLPEYQDKFAKISFQNHGTHIAISIRDQGKGFDWQKFIEFDPDRVFDCNGRGIAMAKMLSFDALEYLGCGNEAIARITIPTDKKEE